MANECSTKPTYSELEAELLRVRGLLQRQWISVEERLPDENVKVLAHGVIAGHCTAVYAYPRRWYADNMPSEPAITHWMPLPTFPQSSELVPQGAESADIGKLDTADKKCAYCKHTHTFQFDEIVDDDCPVVGCPCMHFLAASAETEGEKAASHGILAEICKLTEKPNNRASKVVLTIQQRMEKIRELCLKAERNVSSITVSDHVNFRTEGDCAIPTTDTTFPRSSQNQTVSSGVEGAHEGTTADEKAEAREPEKLNNAHPGCTYSTFSSATCARGNNGCDVKHNSLAESSLSQGANEAPETDTGWPDYKPESSLSSPPPKEKK